MRPITTCSPNGIIWSIPTLGHYTATGRRLDADQDNLRAALAWLETSGQTGRFLRLATAVAWHWDTLGHFQEGLDWLQRALAGAVEAEPGDHACVRCGASASWRATVGAYALADAAGEESLELARALGDQSGMGFALIGLGMQGKPGQTIMRGRGVCWRKRWPASGRLGTSTVCPTRSVISAIGLRRPGLCTCR